MMDQANKLRSMLENKDVDNRPFHINSRVIAITSGKGGVGKTNFAVNLAIHFSKMNKKVIIIDADFGLANIEVLFGIIPRYTLADVLRGTKDIQEVLTQGPMGIQFISGGSGLKELSDVTDQQMHYFINKFEYLDSVSDIILVDTGAGISKSVINFVKASAETIIVTTPEPTSITDAYALIKTVKEEKSQMPDFKIVVNRVENTEEGLEIFEKLNKASSKFLGITLENLGYVPYDNFLVKAVKRQQPAIICYPNCNFSRSLDSIGDQLMHVAPDKARNNVGIKGFMRRLSNIFNN